MKRYPFSKRHYALFTLLLAVAGVILLYLYSSHRFDNREPGALEPDWVTIIYPRPNSYVTVANYDGTRQSVEDISGKVIRTDPTICVRVSRMDIDSGMLGNKRQLQLLVNGDQAPLAPISMWIGPSLEQFCFLAALGTGIHQAEIRLVDNLITIASFKWEFTIVGKQLPTPTPLPTPGFVDMIGKYPDFLHSVYPPPSAAPNPAQNIASWGEDELGLTDQAFITFYKEMLSDNYTFCIAASQDKLWEWSEGGQLHHNYRFWHEQAVLLIDGIEYPIRLQGRFYSEFMLECLNDHLSPGKHTATLIISLADTSPEVYSWTFMID